MKNNQFIGFNTHNAGAIHASLILCAGWSLLFFIIFHGPEKKIQNKDRK
jgi:hypothetical protein